MRNNLFVSDTAERYRAQVTDSMNGFDSRLEPIAFEIDTGWLLTRKTQAHFAVSFKLLNFQFKIISAIFSVTMPKPTR